MDKLPKDEVAGPDGLARCPWCAEFIEEAVLTVGALMAAWFDGKALRRPARSVFGTPDPAEEPLIVTCPHCNRPSMVALQDRPGDWGKAVRFLAVRTETDAKYLGAYPAGAST